MTEKPVLVTGATGYVGGRLVPRLLAAGYRVRALGRSLNKLRQPPLGAASPPGIGPGRRSGRGIPAPGGPGVLGGLLPGALHGRGRRDFAASRPPGRPNMVRAAAAAGLERLIYLGGLGGRTIPT